MVDTLSFKKHDRGRRLFRCLGEKSFTSDDAMRLEPIESGFDHLEFLVHHLDRPAEVERSMTGFLQPPA
jgi:hypothetical protein